MNTELMKNLEFLRDILHSLPSAVRLLYAVFCILYSFVKSRVKNEKSQLIKGKIAKSLTTFRNNKPNFINSEIGTSLFKTDIYEILPAWWGKKANPSKPNLSRNKPNSNPICFNAIIGISSFMTSKYVGLGTMLAKKQTQNKPKQIYPRMSQSGSQYKDQTEPIIVVIKELRCYNSPNYNEKWIIRDK